MTSMTIGDHSRSNLIVHWDYHCLEDSANHMRSPIALANGPDASHYEKAVAVLQRYLPSNKGDVVPPEDRDSDDFDLPVDAFSCDNFRMFEFKVKECVLARSHDWTACPFAHPGEKARRRDPRKFRYAGSACPDFRKGACRRGDACEYAHGVFECWLHPARYRTQQCKDGTRCRRRVCFFAHTPEQLRDSPNTGSPDVPSSGLEQVSFMTKGLFGFSPKSTSYSSPPSSPTTGSPPVSPSGSIGLNSLKQLSESMRHLQLNKMKIDLSLSPSPPFWGLGIRSGSTSLPSTPIPAHAPPWPSSFDAWGTPREEEPAMERVESGRELRERIYAKLGEENSLDRIGRVNADSGASPDLGWVGELAK